MFPIKDINQTITTPHVNRLLLIANVLVFVIYWLAFQDILPRTPFAALLSENFVMIPYDILNGQRLYTIFTSMFMHAGPLHLFGNMLYLFVFGDNIEDIFGHAGYAIFYLVSGVGAAFAQILSTQPSDLFTGIVGASGAISGVLGAYVVLFPRAKILTIVLYVVLPIPAILFLGFWFVMQWLYSFFDPIGGVAYYAHIGGFVVGMIMALVIGLRRKKASDVYRRL